MKANRQRFFQGFVSISCLLMAYGLKAATFDIVFFGANNQRVGQGQFTADPKKIFTLTSDDEAATNACLSGGQTLRECGLQRDFNNLVTQFTATIQGISLDKATTLDVNWDLEGLVWWTGEGHPPGQLASSRYLPSGTEPDVWFFGDPFFGYRQLRMDFNAATDTNGGGTWSMGAGALDSNGQNPLPAFVYNNGTFVITQAPIPAAVWLFASGLGALGAFRQKKLANT